MICKAAVGNPLQKQYVVQGAWVTYELVQSPKQLIENVLTKVCVLNLEHKLLLYVAPSTVTTLSLLVVKDL